MTNYEIAESIIHMFKKNKDSIFLSSRNKIKISLHYKELVLKEKEKTFNYKKK